jgi:hypothetical protein
MYPSTPEMAIDYPPALTFCRWSETRTLASGEFLRTGFAAGGRLMQTEKKPHLMITGTKVGPMSFRCSFCGQLFLLPDDRNPDEATIELMAAFGEHVREEHPEEGKD